MCLKLLGMWCTSHQSIESLCYVVFFPNTGTGLLLFSYMTWICFNNLSIPQVGWGNTLMMIDSQMYFHQHEDPRPSSRNTVDLTNIAPVEVGSLSCYVHCFIYPRWLFGISEPSTVSCHVFCSDVARVRHRCHGCSPPLAVSFDRGCGVSRWCVSERITIFIVILYSKYSKFSDLVWLYRQLVVVTFVVMVGMVLFVVVAAAVVAS